MEESLNELINAWEKDLKNQISMGLDFKRKLNIFIEQNYESAFGIARPDCFEDFFIKCNFCAIGIRVSLN